MGSFSIIHWLIVLVYAAVIVVPTAQILRKAGFSRWWSVLAIIPLVNLVALWLFAFSKWRVLPLAQGEAAR
jgi:uncharacterized membrane protein YhaH (DUF805 family)